MGNYTKKYIDSTKYTRLTILEALKQYRKLQIDPVDQKHFQEKFSSYVKKKYILEDGMQKAYFLVSVQCNKSVHYKAKMMPNHHMISIEDNPILLLGNIHIIMFNF